MKCIILAAGYATRLKPLTDSMPKQLLPLAGKPMLDYLMESLEGLFDEIVIVTNHTFYHLFEQWAKRFKTKVTLIDDGTVSIETRKEVTMDLKLAIDTMHIDDDLFVIYGDNLTAMNPKDFIDFFYKQKSSVIAVYDIKSRELAKKFGIVQISPDKKVLKFVEKPQEPPSTLVSTGLYIFSGADLKKFTQFLKEDGRLGGAGYFVEWLLPRSVVKAFTFNEQWWDIGSIDQYHEADAFVRQNQQLFVRKTV